MRNVLIVDDEKGFLAKLQAGFAEFRDQFAVETAENGKQAIDMLLSSTVDLIVTDLKMPIMDGFELLAYVASNFPAIPVIVMTAFATPETENQLKRTGIYSLLEKPIDFDVLCSTILQGLESNTEEGSLTGISLENFVQLIELEKKTCLLEVQSKQEKCKNGYLIFKQGELWDALIDKLKGEEAAIKIVSLKNVKIKFMKLPTKIYKKNINKSLISILMESSKIEDEKEDNYIKTSEASNGENRDSVNQLEIEQIIIGEAGTENSKLFDDHYPSFSIADPDQFISADSAFISTVDKYYPGDSGNRIIDTEITLATPIDQPSGESNPDLPETLKKSLPKGGKHMALRDVLEQMAQKIDSLVAIGVQGMDGVELAKHSPGKVSTEQFAARFAMVMKLEANIAREIKQLGTLEENIMQTQNNFIYTKMVGANYYLSIIITKEGTLGMVRVVAQNYAEKLQAELG